MGLTDGYLVWGDDIPEDVGGGRMIVIKTMTNLPEHCYDCPCHDGESGYCQADEAHRYSDYRPFWCPLVEVNDQKEPQVSPTGEEVEE